MKIVWTLFEKFEIFNERSGETNVNIAQVAGCGKNKILKNRV